MNELLSAWDMTDVELRVHMDQRHHIVGFVTREEHEHSHRGGLPSTISHKHERPSEAKRNVVAAESMDFGTFFKHVRIRHPELGIQFATVQCRIDHAASHRLIPAILNHWHEPALDDSAAEGISSRQTSG